MHTFTDNEKRVWSIKLTLDLLDKIKAATTVDLVPDDGDPSAIVQLLVSPRQLGQLLWECVRQQACSQEIPRDSFFQALDGETLKGGWQSLVDSLLFFIRSSQGEKMASTTSELIEVQIRVLEHGAMETVKRLRSTETNKSITAILDRIGQQLQKNLDEVSETCATTSAESSESIRGRFHCVS